MMKDFEKYIEAVVALFGRVPYFYRGVSFERLGQGEVRLVDDAEMLKHGIVVTENAKRAVPFLGDYSASIIEKWGYDLLKANNGLHKSFGAVISKDEMQLRIEQALHYVSVFMQTNMDDRDTTPVNEGYVFIPAEKLNLPDDEPVRVRVIDAICDDELVKRVKSLLSGMALSEDTQEHLLVVVRALGDAVSLNDVRNKEFRIRLIDELGLVPNKASELLRYIAYKKTGSSLFLHSRRFVGLVKRNPKGFNCSHILSRFVEKYGVERIAEEFNRHRDLWVILKSDGVRSIINRAAKLAVKLNRPAKVGVLDRIGDKSVTLAEVEAELPKVTLWKRVSIANSMLLRAANPSASLYVVRTGRMFAKQNPVDTTAFMTPARLDILNAVMKSIVDEVRPNVEGKKIRLPENMDYAFPTTEKQFVGTIPSLSTMTFDNGVVFGVHWTDLNSERVDLDLHVTSPNFHVGWNSSFRATINGRVVHSGDKVEAPNGASEVIYADDAMGSDFAALSLNCYTCNRSAIPYTIFVGDASRDEVSYDYLMRGNEVMANINGLEINPDSPEKIVGFLEFSNGVKKLHFVNSALGNSIVSAYDDDTRAACEATKAMLSSRLSLRDVLEKAGAKFELSEGEAWDIDLSIENLTKDSFSFLSSPKDEPKKG